MKIVQIMPAPPGWIAVFTGGGTEGWDEPVVAWGLTETDDGRRYVAPLVVDCNTSAIYDPRERWHFVRLTKDGDLSVPEEAHEWGVTRDRTPEATRCACRSWSEDLCALIAAAWQEPVANCACDCHREWFKHHREASGV